MKKLYCFPTVDVCLLDSEDVIATSGFLAVFENDNQDLSGIISNDAGEGDRVNLNW